MSNKPLTFRAVFTVVACSPRIYCVNCHCNLFSNLNVNFIKHGNAFREHTILAQEVRVSIRFIDRPVGGGTFDMAKT